MEKQSDKKITWVIKNFSSLQSKIVKSDIFVVGRCRWRLEAYPKGNNKANHFSLYLAVADSEFLPLEFNGELKIVVKVDVLEVQGRICKPFVWKTPRYCIKFRTKNPYLNTAYMNILLSLTQTLCQSPWEISKDDLAEEYAALSYLTAEGFQLDWLGKKLDEVKVKKKKEKACLAQLREIEKELQPLKRKYSEMEAQMDKVKAELSAAKSPVSLYDEDVA
ncbi:hypothetical protein F2Q69_00063956 [Brassica cretica]|uniref:MATH domain-containing protein n=1 Tax=Brassica cretica TaxID=69181 RepID=A0A8S9SBW5_BRACR|nr:hypothetical protein F2Q69_00063956 [Brassica cretica]